MDTLQKSRDEVSGLHDQAVEKVRAQEGKVLDNEQLYEQRLDSARSELEALHNELYSRKEMIRSANEAMFVKVCCCHSDACLVLSHIISADELSAVLQSDVTCVVNGAVFLHIGPF